MFYANWMGTTLSVTKVTNGGLRLGSVVSGPGIIPGTVITAFGPNAQGNVGTYVISPPQSSSGTDVFLYAAAYPTSTDMILFPHGAGDKFVSFVV
jgi:hypothetical protein